MRISIVALILAAAVLGAAPSPEQAVLEYEVVSVSPPSGGTVAVRRVLYAGRVSGEVSVQARYLDLDGDGDSEILISEHGAYANCDIRTGGGSNDTLMLLDGQGRVLWRDETRHYSFGQKRRWDQTAHARALDLVGGGPLALRVRTHTHEFYVLPKSARLPETIPVCLE